jgi:hypothetical protein
MRLSGVRNERGGQLAPVGPRSGPLTATITYRRQMHIRLRPPPHRGLGLGRQSSRANHQQRLSPQTALKREAECHDPEWKP